MLIGSQYSDNKVYRGIRHYDSLPLTSGDLHEYADTVSMKNAYIMNNVVGQGVLNTPTILISTAGIRLAEPAVVLLDGDVSLIQSDDNTPIISKSAIENAGYSSGSLCILGWYQHITTDIPLVNYGGVENSKISGLTGADHEFANNEWNVQISSRYQFRWTPIILNTEDLTKDTVTFSVKHRDATGTLIGGEESVTTTKKSGSLFYAPKTSSMDYALSDLYIVPILRYNYSSDTSNITGASAYLPVTPKGSSGFVKSETEPKGEYPDGTKWYNPITREFKTYVVGEGFINSASTMGFLQYQSVYSLPITVDVSRNIDIPINIDELEEGDILQVIYEGLILVAGEHYTVDYNKHVATLLDFTVTEGERITFTATKIVEANDITNITTTFTKHMASTGSDTIEAHVKLSDSIDSDLGVNDGVAATPRAVREATVIKDNAANINYRFGVENGLLYIEEV